jgi:hypothetical protein
MSETRKRTTMTTTMRDNNDGKTETSTTGITTRTSGRPEHGNDAHDRNDGDDTQGRGEDGDSQGNDDTGTTGNNAKEQ